MRSAAAKGSYYKARTKAYYEALGCQVAFLERMMVIPGPRPRYIKRDQFGADLLVIDDAGAILVQVKSERTHLAAARKEFDKYPMPSTVRKWIVVWEPRGREPEVIPC
jgi:hypothetical protein